MYIPKLRNAAAVAEYYKKHDSENAVTKHLLRTLADKKMLICRYVKWMIDLDQFITFFSGKTNQSATVIPSIRTYEKSYHLALLS